jgi:hypothetical protein
LHIKQKDLNLDILKKYAKAIEYDFSNEVSGLETFVVGEEESVYKTKPKTLKDALKQRDEWKDKYYELMEKYQRLLEKK